MPAELGNVAATPEEEVLTPLVSGQAEDEADALAESDGSQRQFRTSISARDWTVETLVSQMRKGRIDLDPTFQRRNAWLGNRKSKLIESILIGYPIPQLVLAENKDRPGSYFVLDGKQRLLALRQFFVDPQDPRDAGFDALKLEQLEVMPELNKLDMNSLIDQQPDLFAALENYTIRTVVLSDWNSERLLLSLFLRLNTGSLTLSPQELRQALIPGDFIRWLDATSGGIEPLLNLLGNKNPDRRMIDAELLLRFLAFKQSPLPYRGNLKSFLDDTCRTLNRSWVNSSAASIEEAENLGKAISAGFDIFGQNGSGNCRKWSGDHYERAVNRAVFDVQTYSLSFPKVREAALANATEIEEAYCKLCDSSPAFNSAITSTTKTREAFLVRHRLWREEISRVSGESYDLPASLTAG
jgi:hypothetical protein